MSKLLVINGSYRHNGNTYKALLAEETSIREQHSITERCYIFLPDDLKACLNCSGDKRIHPGCVIKDQFKYFVEEILTSDRILIGSPVYLDFPSPKLLAFLSRLTSYCEAENRTIFKDKKVHLLATGLCSGTKTVIHTLMGAVEMLGFTIEGRSTKEYISLWKDKKIRGGFPPHNQVFLEDV